MDSAFLSWDDLVKRDNCVQCSESPKCNCSNGEQCILTSRTCSQCPQIKCIPGSSSSSGAVNPGVIAGPVVAVLVIASGLLFWWLRRKKRRDLNKLEQLAERARKAESAGFALSQPNSPAPASLNRSISSSRTPSSARLSAPPPTASRRSSPLPPASMNAEYLDENGDTVRVYGRNGTINLDPRHPDNGGDPFSDRQSISTNGTSTHSTNIIPIQYIPSSTSKSGNEIRSPDIDQQSQAARRLDEARQNLFRPGTAGSSSIPQRPARSGDGSYADPRSPGGGIPRIRDSYVSDNSGAPSFLSGNSYDVHNDAPKIMTSKQVQLGRFQPAEFVQWGASNSNRANQDSASGSESVEDPYDREERTPSPATFGPRTIAPQSPGYSTAEGLRRSDSTGSGTSGVEPQSAGSTDLRFSMGSLARESVRDSMSSMGTNRFLAQPPQPGSNLYGSPAKPPTVNGHGGNGPRESVWSNKSNADSFLSGFPMMFQPSQPGSSSLSNSHTPQLPGSVSQATLDGSNFSRPPPSYRPPTTTGSATTSPGRSQGQGSDVGHGEGGNGGGGSGRPLTQASVADSFLGTFPFVPPNMDDLAELPSAGVPTAVVPETPAKKR